MNTSKARDDSYQYRDAEGNIVYEKIVRKQDDTVTIYWRDAGDTSSMNWRRNIRELTCELSLYQSDKLPNAKTVFILPEEMEADWCFALLRDAHHILKTVFSDLRSIAVTCVPNNEWDDAYSFPLMQKEVIIVPRFNDAQWAESIAKRLFNDSTKVKILRIPFTSPDLAVSGNLGLYGWFNHHGGEINKFRKLLVDTPDLTADQVNAFRGEINLIDAIKNMSVHGEEYILGRIAQIRSDRVRKNLTEAISQKFGKDAAELTNRITVITDKKEGKVVTQPEANELRLPGLIDIAVEDKKTMKKVYVMLDEKGKIQIVPHVDGYNAQGQRVRFVPPASTEFTLPFAKDVLHYYEKDDAALFPDIMAMSEDYVYLKEIDRLLMIATVFTSYIINHKDVHYLPILFMCSEPNHGKSHVLQFIAWNGYRGKWYRSFNLPNCIRYNDAYQSLICLDVFDFAEVVKTSGSMDFVLGKIERGSKIPRVNKPSAGRYEQIDEYDPYGMLIVGSNSPIPGNLTALKSRVLPIENVLLKNKALIKKPDNASMFEIYRSRLTAWKAKAMQKTLKVREHIDLEGRLFNMGEAFLMVLNDAYPQAYDPLVAYLRKQERNRLRDKSDSGEAAMLSVIRMIAMEETSAHLIKTGERPKAITLSQKRMIGEIQKLIPNLSGKAVMNSFRYKYGFTEEPVKHSHDYLHHINLQKLDDQLEAWGLRDKEEPATVELPQNAEPVKKIG